VRRFPTLAVPVPGVVIVRLDGPLFFANISLFIERVVSAAFPGAAAAAAVTAAAPDAPAAAAAANGDGTHSVPSSSSSSSSPLLPTRAVLLDFSTVSSIDSAGVHAISESLPAALAKAAAVRPAGSSGGGGPRLFLVGARGPIRDRLRAGERAHEHAHARAGPGLAASLTGAASRAFCSGGRGSSGGASSPAAAAAAASGSAPPSDGAVSLGGLYAGASAASAVQTTTSADTLRRSVVDEVLARADPATGALPAEALTLFWHVDLHQGVQAVEVVLRGPTSGDV
jgi:hypothetical protein